MPGRKFTLFLAGWLCVVCSGAGAEPFVLVKANTLSLREKRSANSPRIRWLRTYDPVDLKKRNGEWAEVKTADGANGWVLAKYLTSNSFVTVDETKLKNVGAKQLNVRQGPGKDYPVIIRVGPHYPLSVVKRASNWLLVEDFEGDRGWVSENLIGFKPYVITRLKSCNIRTGPGTDHSIAYTATDGVILKVLGDKKGWLEVIDDEGDKGWISANIVFGWKPVKPTKKN